uniref:Uncharacterized protein n=1 Tax=Rhizophora mucronata TaxID=61149 RepID=A0A2P2N677_RHIMU
MANNLRSQYYITAGLALLWLSIGQAIIAFFNSVFDTLRTRKYCSEEICNWFNVALRRHFYS